MQPNIARNMKSFQFRKAKPSDAVVVVRGEEKDGSPFIVVEKVNHPILVFHRDFEFPTPSPRDTSGNLVLRPLAEVDYLLYKGVRGRDSQYVQRGMNVVIGGRRRLIGHSQRTKRDRINGLMRSHGILNPTPAQFAHYAESYGS